MNKRGAGVAFIAICAFLISANYGSASILGSGVASSDESLYKAMLDYVALGMFSFFTFRIGIAYVIWGEYEDWKSKKMNEFLRLRSKKLGSTIEGKCLCSSREQRHFYGLERGVSDLTAVPYAGGPVATPPQ